MQRVATGCERTIRVCDVLYGSIEFPPLLVKVIDTPFFQRLQRLLQLGVCHYIYPGATHTRKSHCMGASHLAGVWMRHLQTTQPELHITERMIQLVRLAALLHDIGHTFYSHLFDRAVAPHLNIPRKNHEERSLHLLQLLSKDHDLRLGLTQTEVDMVGAMITGQLPAERSSAWPDYLFQIVAYEIDVDKMDYLLRDSYYTGLPCGFQYDRLIHNTRVIDGQLCFNYKVARNIMQLFHTRFYFHSEIYQHKTCMVLCAMMSDAINDAAKDLDLESMFQDDVAWCELDDFSIQTHILQCKNASFSRELLSRIESRNFYPKHVTCKRKLMHISQTEAAEGKSDRPHEPEDNGARNVKPQPPHASQHAERPGTPPIQECKFGVFSSTVGYTNEDVNPLTKLWFFHSERPYTKHRLNTEETTLVLPQVFAETRQISFSR